ncbi:MAG TPA: DNA cytosine methyltransferase [Planctomycetota bacterium]|nr:DNA cytosine methyltransferase [Planctomycetota bacterium]
MPQTREPTRTPPRRASAADDRPTVIELFAGCGGMALGFRQAGFATVLANEISPAACATLRANVTPNVVEGPVESVASFPRADVVAGGPPCQGFSNLGTRAADDPRNRLWRHFLRCVAEAEPLVFVLENVPPLLKSREYDALRQAAARLGYQVEGRVLNFADYGVPQTRKRAIVIGSRLGGPPTFPPPTHGDPRRGLAPGLKPWATVRDAIGHVPRRPDGRSWHVGRSPTPMSLERYRSIPEGGNRFDLPTRLTPECWKRKTEGGTDLFGRLWWDRPSVTIRTEFYKPEKGRYLHPTAHRPITHREAAILQGFPEDFEFHGSKTEVGVQIGNAVPPPLAAVLARHIRRRMSETAAPERRTG